MWRIVIGMLALLAILAQSDVPRDLSGHSAAILGDRVAVVGSHREPSTWLYSISKKTWKRGTAMPHRRVFSGYVERDGKLILIGGLREGGIHSAVVDAFDVRADRWSTHPSLPTPATRVAACLWQGKLYVSGGYNGESDRIRAANSDQLLCFDFQTKKWMSLPSMPTPRHAHSLIPFAGRLWAVGGYGNEVGKTGVAESYDPVRGDWRQEMSLPAARGFFGTAIVDGKLVAFGTVDGLAHSVEWSLTGWKDRKAPDLPVRRFAYVRHGKGFLIFGGEPEGPFVREYRP